MALMRVAKQLPQIPEEKLGKWGAFVGAGMVVVAIVQPRVEQDARMQQLPSGASPRVGAQTFERINPDVPLPPDLERAVREGRAEVRTMTAEEYARFAQSSAGALDGYPTVAATDETLLDRVIAETEGVDQATLADQARADGRLESS